MAKETTMNDKTLSILIPARNEMFISRTVQDILDHIEGDTEIIVGLDGLWAEPAIPDDPRVKILYYPESIGQRAMTNQCARMSNAKYVLKVDAHCTFDQGFDRKLMEDMEDDWTVVPIMRNLHAFDWMCPKCGSRWYQGPTPSNCLRNTRGPGDGTEPNPECDNTKGFTREIVWQPNPNRPNNSSYCFDSEPHFQYFREFNRRPEGKGDLTETMSLQGSCFMMTREKYWSLDICNEDFGSWGSQGIEVAAKTWLSGGKVMCNQKTWYAHMFRTQGGDFTFPYPQDQRNVDKAKKHAKNLFFGNRWPQQIHPMSWLVEKFWPVPGWSDKAFDDLKKEDKRLWKQKV